MKRMPDDLSRAFGRADREFVYRVQTTLEDMKNQEDKKVKRKLSLGLILAIILVILLTGTALALTVGGWGHIEQAMDIATEYEPGEYGAWSLDAKIRLIDAMREDGMEIADADWQSLHGAALTEQEKHALADQILTGYYGEEEYLYYYTIAVTEWGEPQTWDLKQRHWFFKTLREKGLYGDDSWIDLLPEEGDLTQQEAEAIAKRAVAEAFGLSGEEMAHLHGDVSFFITDEYDIPRWQICLYRDENVWATQYTVLLTRDGQVTEDPRGLGVWTPAHEKQRREEADKKAESSQTVWEQTARARLDAGEAVYYNPAGGTFYHFLQDCPLVEAENLPLTALEPESEEFSRLSPCPACVKHDLLWPMRDRISPFPNEEPGADWIGEEKALEIAVHAMQEKDIDVNGLYPVVCWTAADRWNERAEYVVYFAAVSFLDAGDAQILFQYSVEIDPVTGEVVSIGETIGNG